jgi:chorismate mutase
MDSLEKWSRDIDVIDNKILTLFEQRMGLVRKSAEYKKKHGLKPDKKSEGGVTEKVTKGSCDADSLVYAEGLFTYLHNASVKYECGIMKR